VGAPAVGAVVLVRFPFSDLSRAKLRPAIVLAHAGRDDAILCQVTSKPYGDARAFAIGAADFATGSLRVASIAAQGSCSPRTRRFRRRLGTCPRARRDGIGRGGGHVPAMPLRRETLSPRGLRRRPWLCGVPADHGGSPASRARVDARVRLGAPMTQTRSTRARSSSTIPGSGSRRRSSPARDSGTSPVNRAWRASRASNKSVWTASACHVSLSGTIKPRSFVDPANIIGRPSDLQVWGRGF